MSELSWTAVLRCSDCKLELNRAVHVPESQRGRVNISSAFAAPPCPNACRSTFSDLNINTDLEWVREDSDRVRGSA